MIFAGLHFVVLECSGSGGRSGGKGVLAGEEDVIVKNNVHNAVEKIDLLCAQNIL